MGLKYAPQVFDIMEPYECLELIEKSREMFEFEHKLMYIAVKNAIGNSINKRYKYIDVFEKDKKKSKVVTEEEREKLKEYFESW